MSFPTNPRGSLTMDYVRRKKPMDPRNGIVAGNVTRQANENKCAISESSYPFVNQSNKDPDVEKEENLQPFKVIWHDCYSCGAR